MSLMVLALVFTFGLVHLFEVAWSNRPPELATRWPKGRAMRFTWAATGVLLLALVGHEPAGMLILLAGIPVCLGHLKLVDRQPSIRIRIGDVFREIVQAARMAYRRLMDQSGIGLRRK